MAVATSVFAALLLFYGLHYPLHHDLAGSLLSGRLAVELGDSYRDYSMYFPPAERVWFAIAARLSDLTGIRPDLAVVAMTAVMVIASAELAYRIRRVTVGARPHFLVTSAALLVILPILFKNVFGLREHLVVLGLWPYLVLRVSDPEGVRVGRGMRLVLGVWMGATLLFKYLYSVVVLLVEVADVIMQRRAWLLLRIENLAAGAIVALYLFCWLVLDPSQRTAIGAVVSAIDANLADPRTNWLQAARQSYLAIFFLLASRIFRVPGRVTAIGLALVAGAIIVAWTQERWYTHHLFPIVLAYAAWWWMARGAFRWWAHAVIGLWLLVPFIREYLGTATYLRSVRELDQAMEAAGQSVAGKRVAILNMHPSPYNQYLASHRAVRWSPAINNSSVAAELKAFDRPENANTPPPPVKFEDPGRQMLHDQMLRLWEDMPPDALILDHSTRWPLIHTDVEWTQVFSEDARFNAILSRYRPVVQHKGETLEFRYYVRKE